jgi:alkaline phosphatase
VEGAEIVKMNRYRALCSVIACLAAAGAVGGAASDGEWRVVAGDRGGSLPVSAPAPDDARSDIAIEDLRPGARVRLRSVIEVSGQQPVTGLTLELASLGPASVSVNGIEVFSSERPLPYRVDAASGRVLGFEIGLSGIVHELLPGANLIEVEIDGWMAPPRLRVTMGPAAVEHLSAPTPATSSAVLTTQSARYVILMICDGWGPRHLEAANLYTGTAPSYQTDASWTSLWMATFPYGGSYDGSLAWSDFDYPLQGTTDSAAAATAMMAGSKTRNGRICVDGGGTTRLAFLGEHARTLAVPVGAVTTVPVSHATPGAFTAHNLSRGNTYAIADEAFFGDPNTTGDPGVHVRYGGGFGPTRPPTSVVIGSREAAYVHAAQRDKLAAESGLPGKHVLVEGEDGVDGALALLTAAGDPVVTLLAGLFDRANLRVTRPDGGYRLETPSLAESTAAALTVLDRPGAGFVLAVEGGAVDWAAHGNTMDWVLGELLDFNDAVTTVLDWVEDPANDSGWSNTLVVVTGDHETGYLSAGPGVFPDEALGVGSVSDATLALEKVNLDTGRRASWVDDNPPNDRIDPGETVHWAWNSDGHTNTLVPIYCRGIGSELLDQLSVGTDPVRGPYIDNTAVFSVMHAVLEHDALFVDGFETGDVSRW